MKPLWPSHYTPPGQRHIPRQAIDVLTFVARQLRIPEAELAGTQRSARLVRSRAVLAGVLHGRGMSLNTIGGLLGNRSHTTIKHSLRMLPQYVARPEIERLYEKTRLYANGVGR